MDEAATPKMIKSEDMPDIRVANIVEAGPHPNADNLLILQVRIGEDMRQIVARIRKFYEPEKLVGKQILVVTNLEPRKVRGEMSNGMLLAASDGSGNLALVVPDKQVASGSQVR